MTPVHFAATIYTDHAWIYRALCGYTDTDAAQFSNEHGVVLKRQGGRITCLDCQRKIGVKRDE